MMGVLSASSSTATFPARTVSVTARLFERFVRTLRRAEPCFRELQRLEDFSFHEVFPGGAGHLLGHRPRNRVADIRVRKLLYPAGMLVSLRSHSAPPLDALGCIRDRAEAVGAKPRWGSSLAHPLCLSVAA